MGDYTMAQLNERDQNLRRFMAEDPEENCVGRGHVEALFELIDNLREEIERLRRERCK